APRTRVPGALLLCAPGAAGPPCHRALPEPTGALTGTLAGTGLPACPPPGGVRQWSADMCQMSPRTVTCNNFVTKASHMQLPVIQAWTCIAGIMRPPWRQKPSLICAGTGWNSVTLDHRNGMARPASAQTGPSSHIH
ncbi:hypothetical protein, partial [uncultured Duncaniella sp.]|uniref:hypothetical protein n=1 Tax=uncultured Duncaniella sp. TaxID=2768039 RepID=UPI0026F153B8